MAGMSDDDRDSPPTALPGRERPGGSDDEPLRPAARVTPGLLRTIEGEIIPRLMLAHAIDPAGLSPRPSHPRQADIDRLTQLALGQDPDAALEFVRALIADGLSLEAAYLELLAPAARGAGGAWEEDRCSFTDVTIGLWRLQAVMHELRGVGGPPTRSPDEPRKVLLRLTPGEQHGFGLSIVAEFFRRAGWTVHDEISEAGTEPVDNVRDQWFDLVGLSLSAERHLDTLARTIHAIRRVSRNRHIGVLVGGPLFTQNPDWVARVGADATAHDALHAVQQGQAMVGLLAAQH